jgi:lincosamide nucleotidyltransferase
MTTPSALLARLDVIGTSIRNKGNALALIGLGSVGVETERLDEFSDLDFFLIAAPGYKNRFIGSLDWLEAVHPVAYSFKNSEVGYKILFEDGIYGEYAVFEPGELESAMYRGGRVIWRHPSFSEKGLVDGNLPLPSTRSLSLNHVVGEAVTNLYVGLGRYLRGEKMSAYRFVQVYPIDGLLSVLPMLETENSYYPDAFGNERRLEIRFPDFSKVVGGLLLGYDRTPESALQLLAYLKRISTINPRMQLEIQKLAERCMEQRDGKTNSVQ